MAKKTVNISYKVIKIHTTKFSFEDVDEEKLNEIVADEDKPNLNINVSISSRKEKSTVTFDVTSYFLNPEDNSQPLVTHTARTIFYIKNIEDIYEKETDKINIPDQVALQFLSISFTHARAVLAMELSSTVYRDKYFLPVVDPMDLFKGLNQKKEA